MVPWHERSGASHRHEFAELKEAWSNLPEPWSALCPTEQHLRKLCLCMAGFSEAQTFVCPTPAFAAELLWRMRPYFDWATIDGRSVTLHKAHSQSYAATDKKTFQKQKQGIIDKLEELLGVEPGSLTAHAGRAA
jgi:hypothetical protein